jgi:N-acetylglucosaminyl-diphospho-decaprenol L-rhamnosyltransferase
MDKDVATPRIGVVIVMYRSGDLAARTLASLERAGATLGRESSLRAVLVDNASGDGSAQLIAERAPWAELIESPRNLGFAAACNLGIGRLRESDLILLLNPDVELAGDFLVRLAAMDWPPNLAARGPAICDVHGNLEQSARGFPTARTAFFGRSSVVARVLPTSRLLRKDLLATTDRAPRLVDWVAGSCLIVPADRFQAIGFLDPEYFMYWEDADWCRRAHERGYVVAYEPSLAATHRQGSSSRYRPFATAVWFHRSAFRYWCNHVATTRCEVLAGAVGLTARCAVTLLFRAVRRPIAIVSAMNRRSR